jgi:hypothetical protein
MKDQSLEATGAIFVEHEIRIEGASPSHEVLDRNSTPMDTLMLESL